MKTGGLNIVLPQRKSSSVVNFSFATVPGTGAAAGFKFFPHDMESNLLDWSVELRFVNGSNENIIINQVSCEFYGIKGYISKSRRHVNISREISNLERAKKLLGETRGTSLERYFPLMIPTSSEKVFRFDFILEVYKKIFFFTKEAKFKENEIIPPDTYQDLIQKIVISVEVQGYYKPLFLQV